VSGPGWTSAGRIEKARHRSDGPHESFGGASGTRTLTPCLQNPRLGCTRGPLSTSWSLVGYRVAPFWRRTAVLFGGTAWPRCHPHRGARQIVGCAASSARALLTRSDATGPSFTNVCSIVTTSAVRHFTTAARGAPRGLVKASGPRDWPPSQVSEATPATRAFDDHRNRPAPPAHTPPVPIR
jgi:hypothetical protein